MKAQYINPILESTVNALSTMAMMEVNPGTPSIKKDDTGAMGDVTGVIDLSGSDANGSLTISFTKPAILEITQKMLGEDLDNIDETVVDLVGELTNMIAGGAKRIYSEQGLDFDLTLPTTIVGSNSAIERNITGPTIILPFTTESGPFYIEFCFQ